MNKILDGIFKSGIYVIDNNQIKIHSETSKGQCLFLQKIIAENNCRKSIEIGLAYGISSIAIIESILANNGAEHVIIDKFQSLHWGNIGIKILDDAGYKNHYIFHEDFCYKTLCYYIQQNEKFDFAYIDSTKLFDWILTDFFLLDKLIDDGGIIVFDDANYPSIRKVLRFILNLPHYGIIGQFPKNKKNHKKIFFNKIIKQIPYHKKIFKNELILTDFELGINTNCIAIQKKSADNRKYDWHSPF